MSAGQMWNLIAHLYIAAGFVVSGMGHIAVVCGVAIGLFSAHITRKEEQ